MSSVNNAQIYPAVYQAGRRRYYIDPCSAQRDAIEAGKIACHAFSHGHYPGRQISETLLPGVTGVGFLDITRPQDWSIPTHRNEGIEICYQETGSSVLKIGGVSHAMPVNALSVTRPWQLHSLGGPGLSVGRLHWIIIDVGVRQKNQSWRLPDWCVLTSEDQDELIDLLRNNVQPIWKGNVEVERIFKQLGKCVLSPSPERVVSRMRIYVNELLAALLDVMRGQGTFIDSTNNSRRHAVELFLEHLQGDAESLSYEWSLEAMAEHCGMGRSAFSAYCRELLNTTPMDALNQWRIELAAKRLREEPRVKVTEIALACGFSSSQYFARAFRRAYGQSPCEWRKQ